MDRSGPEGQWNPPGGSVEACDESWSPRSNATALAGFALTTTTTNYPGMDGFMHSIIVAKPYLKPVPVSANRICPKIVAFADFF